jgi:hypothetical protein
MHESKLLDKLKTLTNDELITLSEELRLPTVAQDALVRKVIEGTEVDSASPILAFVSVSQLLGFVLSDRLIQAEQKCNELQSDLDLYAKHGYTVKELREYDAMNY